MAHWRTVVTLTGAACLVVGTALAQHQILPPNRTEKQVPPNAPERAPAHWGPLVEDAGQDALKNPKPSRDPKSKPRGYPTTHKGEAQAKSPSPLPSDAAEEEPRRPVSDR